MVSISSEVEDEDIVFMFLDLGLVRMDWIMGVGVGQEGRGER